MAFGEEGAFPDIVVLPQGSDTSGSSEINTSTPSSILSFNTHNTSRAKYHMKDLGCFAADVENSVKRAFPNTGGLASRYENVHALLLRWEHDDMGVNCELEELDQVFTSYGFNTEIWLIPSEDSHLKLTIKAASFVKEHQNNRNLLVVYYGGHAAINSARQSTWYCKRDPQFASISLEWSAIQTVFERAVSDVVLLLDCCHAASAAPQTGRAMTEIIAACGWEAISPLPGPWSFTAALIEVLKEWICFSFSVAMLHSKVLSVLKHEKPEQRGPKKRKVECRRTPVYILTTADPEKPSINFSKLQSRSGAQAAQSAHATSMDIRHQQPLMSSTAKPLPHTYNNEELTSLTPTRDLKVPHVLLSLALDEDQELDASACSIWLASFPALARYATVKAVFKSHSILILISMPVLIWDLLPENPACSFIGYVTSENLLDYSKAKDETSMMGAHEEMQNSLSANFSQSNIPSGNIRTFWKCCCDMREVRWSVWGDTCPDCGHVKCGSCIEPYIFLY